MKIVKKEWLIDSNAIYITPLIGFSYGKNYDTAIWIGWLSYLFTITFTLKEDK